MRAEKPVKSKGRVVVDAYVHGWCPAQNMAFERAKRRTDFYFGVIAIYFQLEAGEDAEVSPDATLAILREIAARLKRFVRPADAVARLAGWKFVTLHEDLHEPEEIQKKLQRDPDLFLVAEAQGRLIGTIIGGYDGRRGLIYHLAVEATYRQQGIGSLLMDEVERRLKAKGCIKCYLMVADDNEDAMRYYEKRHWERMDTIYTYSKEL